MSAAMLMRQKLHGFTIAFAASISLTGCSQSINDQPRSISPVPENLSTPAIKSQTSQFSGRFLVFNHGPETIILKPWEGFGFASPSGGIIIPNAKKGTEFPSLSQFPDSTTVRWKNEGSDELKSQKIDLTGIVPANVVGTTRFDLGSNGEWTVRFVLGDD